jgi:hypothetical protein
VFARRRRHDHAVRSWMISIALVAACKDGPQQQPDASVPLDAALCPQAGDCPCFTNYDCPPTHACVSQDPGGAMVSCVEGPRGTGAAGTPCTGEADCASALCVEDAQGGLRCSDVCRTSESCPPELPRCISLGTEGICVREPPSA